MNVVQWCKDNLVIEPGATVTEDDLEKAIEADLGAFRRYADVRNFFNHVWNLDDGIHRHHDWFVGVRLKDGGSSQGPGDGCDGWLLDDDLPRRECPACGELDCEVCSSGGA